MSRGRAAYSPLEIPLKGWADIGWRIYTRLGKHRIGLIAAGVAFYSLFALFPAITATVAIVGLVFDASLLLERGAFLLDALPAQAADMIATQVAQVTRTSSDSLGWTAIAATALVFWSASRGMGSLLQGLNIITNEDETRNIVMLKLVTTLLTLCLFAVLALAVLVVAAIPAMLMYLGVAQELAALSLILRWPVMFVIGVVAIAGLYRYGPSRRSAQWKWLSPGAVLACALWVAGSFGFSLYVEEFDTFNRTFGALAGVIVLLTWLWLSAFVVLLGGLVDAEIEAQTARDTTVGPRRPMGERGAFMADHLGERFREKPRW